MRRLRRLRMTCRRSTRSLTSSPRRSRHPHKNKTNNQQTNNSWQALKAEIEGCKIDDSEDEETTKLIQDPQKPQTLNTKKQNC